MSSMWVNISPEDKTEDTYIVLETRSENEGLKEVMIACKTCGTIIHLRGFEQLKVIQ